MYLPNRSRKDAGNQSRCFQIHKRPDAWAAAAFSVVALDAEMKGPWVRQIALLSKFYRIAPIVQVINHCFCHVEVTNETAICRREPSLYFPS